MRDSKLLILLATVVSCQSGLSPREDDGRGTFGEELATLMCKRIDYHSDLEDGDDVVDVAAERANAYCHGHEIHPQAPAAASAFQATRPDFEAAIDHVVSKDLEPKLQSVFATDIVHKAHESGLLRRVLGETERIVREVAEDPEALSAASRLIIQAGNYPADTRSGFVGALVAKPEVSSSWAAVLRELSPGGASRDQFVTLTKGLGASMRNFQSGDSDAWRLAVDFLVAERTHLGTGTPNLGVALDKRGMPIPLRDNGAWPMGLVDADGDGLADIDRVGNFVDESGAAIRVAGPFPDTTLPDLLSRSEDGRLRHQAGGAFAYRYRDNDTTVLAQTTRMAPQLFDPQTRPLLKLVGGMQKLMGPRVTQTREYDDGETLTYDGFDADAAPIMSLAWSATNLLRHARADDVLSLGRRLLVADEAKIARASEALVTAVRSLDSFPQAALGENAALIDDMVPVLARIAADEALTEDLIVELASPRTQQLMEHFARFMTYSDKFTLNADQEVVGDFTKPVDRSRSDSGDNRSLMHRLLYLVADANGLRFCNKQDGRVTDPLNLGIPLERYDECELIQIDNVALFYVQSIAYKKDDNGNVVYDDGKPVPKAELDFNWDNVLISLAVNDNRIESMIGIEGFRTHPTPQALNRVLLLDPQPPFLADIADPVKTRNGISFNQIHADALPAWEKNNFYDDIRPLIQVFADHDQEQLLVDLLVVLYYHYSSKQSSDHSRVADTQGYNLASNVQSFEPYLATLFDDPEFVPALSGVMAASANTTVAGQSGARVLARFMKFALAHDTSLTTWSGETEVVGADGRIVAPLSPMLVAVDALRQAADATASDPTWEQGVSGLVDVLLRADKDQSDVWHFRQPGMAGLGIAGIDFVQARLAAHASDRQQWLQSDLPSDIAEAISGPVLSSAVDLVASLPEESRRQLSVVLATALGEDEQQRAATAELALILQRSRDIDSIAPLVRILGRGVGDGGWIDANVQLVGQWAKADERGVMISAAARLFTDYEPGRMSLVTIGSSIGSVLRERPAEDFGMPYTFADAQAIADGIANFIGDEERGLLRIATILERRQP